MSGMAPGPNEGPGISSWRRHSGGTQPRERLIPYIRCLHQALGGILVKNVHSKSHKPREIKSHKPREIGDFQQSAP